MDRGTVGRSLRVWPIAGANETPWERWTGRKASASWVRVWGCVAYAKLYKPDSKVHDQAVRTILLGRHPDQPGWICFDPANNSILVTLRSRD